MKHFASIYTHITYYNCNFNKLYVYIYLQNVYSCFNVLHVGVNVMRRVIMKLQVYHWIPIQPIMQSILMTLLENHKSPYKYLHNYIKANILKI